MSPAKRFHVLIATDGWTPARVALTTAVRFPWPAGARGSAVVVKQVRAEYRRSMLLAALDRTAEFTAKGAERAISRRWPDGHARVVDASPVEGILKEAKRVRADVIVLGWPRPRRCAAAAHGPRLPRRHQTRPLLRAGGQTATSRIPPYRHRPGRLVERRTCGEFPRRGHTTPRGHVTLLTVVDTMHVPTHGLAPAGTRATVAAEVSRINEARRASARKDLSRAAAVLSAAGWEVDQVVTEGAPLRELLAMVAKARADLVIVGARGVTGLRHLLLGSVSEGALNPLPFPCSSSAEPGDAAHENRGASAPLLRLAPPSPENVVVRGDY